MVGGIFLLVYIILALTFGYTLIMAETSLGRMTRKSPVGAFEALETHVLIHWWLDQCNHSDPHRSLLFCDRGWVIKYLIEYFAGT